jgi:beta-phosphoglucomutase-like phosphatase (HAD superfamily)
MGLASMNNRIVVDHMLDRMNLTKYFNAVLTVEDVLKFKPDPEIFLKCASRLATNPLKSVVIEDSIFGVQAAKAARMSCIAVGTGAYNRDELKKAGAELVVNSLAELDAILLFIFN